MSTAGLEQAFAAAARCCSTIEELAGLLDEATAALGFDCFALLHHRSLCRDDARLIRIDTYPADWGRELVARGLVGHDPVHLASLRTNVGFSWAELPELVNVDDRSAALLELAPMFGIGEGFTVPVNVPGEPSGSCSFAVRPGADLPSDSLLASETIGAHAFGAARRLSDYPRRARRPRLSRRERECLGLVAAGKTDWAIAAILGLSIETVHQYVKRARAAYDVVSRTQLVACGLRDALLTFDEAIPPSEG